MFDARLGKQGITGGLFISKPLPGTFEQSIVKLRGPNIYIAGSKNQPNNLGTMPPSDRGIRIAIDVRELSSLAFFFLVLLYHSDQFLLHAILTTIDSGVALSPIVSETQAQENLKTIS